MSKIPPPKTIPSPKSVSDKKAASTREHEDLLLLFWQNRDAIADIIYSPDEDRFDATLKRLWRKYQDKLMAVSETVAGFAASGQSAEGVLPDWSRLQHHLKVLAKGKMPPLPYDSILSTISEAHLAHELTVQKPLRDDRWRTRTEVVGFVDAYCVINALMINRLGFDSDLSGLPTSSDTSRWAMGRWANAANEGITPPSWPESVGNPDSHCYLQYGLAVDVRPQLPPIGQLLRELKTLQEYLPTKIGALPLGTSHVMVVTNEASADIQNVLKHEGFMILTRGWIESLAQ